jgi:hypothetical protein
MEKLRDLIKKKYRINRLRKYSQRAGGGTSTTLINAKELRLEN